MKCTAIVLAAGKGSRMKSSVQKQYMELEGFPLIYYALRTFEKSCVDEVILVTGQEEVGYCRAEIVDKYQFLKVKKIVVGGSERYLSVYQGLCAADYTDIVLIHDGARPFVTKEVIERTILAAAQYGSGVAAVPSKDTVKLADSSQFAIQTPPREEVWIVQTPQAFQFPLVFQAYQKVAGRQDVALTDDAMVIETVLHKPVKLVMGSYRNIKVTTPEDLDIAAAFAAADKKGEI